MKTGSDSRNENSTNAIEGVAKVAILGGGGYFGGRFVEICVTKDCVSIQPILRSFRSLARLSRLPLRWSKANTEDADELAAALRGSDYVLNATMGDWLKILPDTRVVYEACKRAGVQTLIHLSSAAVFGSVENPRISDDTPAEGAEWFMYSREKARAEEFLRAKMEENSPRVVVLRPCLIWGPRSGWSTRPATQLLTDQAWLTNRGEGICNLCYADNLVNYILQVIGHPAPKSGFYNISDEETVTWRGYYEALAVGLGLPLSRVRLTQSARVTPSPKVAVEWFKSQPVGYRIFSWIVTNFSAEGKSLLKWYLPAFAGGGSLPPLPPSRSAPASTPPKFTRETWSAHHTRRKLPNDKFLATFGRPPLISFNEAMHRTAAWLEFAGYRCY